jgi:hypothetical protein
MHKFQQISIINPSKEVITIISYKEIAVTNLFKGILTAAVIIPKYPVEYTNSMMKVSKIINKT